MDFAQWKNTLATLHMLTQIVGKIRLAQMPLINHWWQVTLYTSSRGLTTGPMPHGARHFQIDFDFLEHALEIRADDWGMRSIPLVAGPIAEYYRQIMSALRELKLDVHIWPVPSEVEMPIPFDRDFTHQDYDPDAAQRFWHALLETERFFTQFRSRFIGKVSPIHFFWGGFDMAVTRFSGRPAPVHGSVPNMPDRVVREAYSHEVSSAGFWPGGETFPHPVFYSYAYGEPPGFADARIAPQQAFYNKDFGEFMLRYDDVRSAPDPDAALLDFLQSTYEAAAECGKWDRTALERQAP